MYTPYVKPYQYTALGYDAVPAEDLIKYLRLASHHIDELTFNRILHHGFENLTEFQQGIVQTVICQHAEFLYQNADIISSVFNEYSINGVSMKFGDGVHVVYEAGVPIERATLSLLKQTGLCCRLAV